MKCNLGELSELSGLSVNTIKEWVEGEGMPYITRPEARAGTAWLFDSADVFRFAMTRSDAAQKDRDKESKSKQLEAEAGIKWMDYGERQDELIPKMLITPHIEAGDAIVKSRLRALPGRLAQQMAVESDPAVCLTLLKDEVEDALAELNKNWTQRG